MNTDVYGHERTARAAEALTALRNDLAHTLGIPVFHTMAALLAHLDDGGAHG